MHSSQLPDPGTRVWLRNPDERGVRKGRPWARPAEAARHPWRHGDTAVIVDRNRQGLVLRLDRTGDTVATNLYGLVDRYYSQEEQVLARANARAAGLTFCQSRGDGLAPSWGWWRYDPATGHQVGAGYPTGDPSPDDPEPISTSLCDAYAHRLPPCEHCGAGMTRHDAEQHSDGHHWCFTCRFWLTKVGDPAFMVALDHLGRPTSYCARYWGIRGGDNSCKGFGGAVLRFRDLATGDVRESNDVFTQGQVPEAFRALLPVTHELVRA